MKRKIVETLKFLVICSILVSCGSPPLKTPSPSSTPLPSPIPVKTSTPEIDSAAEFWWFDGTDVESDRSYQFIVSFININGNLKGTGEISAVFFTGGYKNNCELVHTTIFPFEVYGSHQADGFIFQQDYSNTTPSESTIILGYYCNSEYQWVAKETVQSFLDNMEGQSEGGNLIAEMVRYENVLLSLETGWVVQSCKFIPQDGYQIDKTTDNSRTKCVLHQGIMPTPTPIQLSP